MSEDNKLDMIIESIIKLASKNKLELRDTISLMTGDFYEERFIAEYLQTEIRCNKLLDMIRTMENSNNTAMYVCDIEDLKKQLLIMKQYIDILELRAEKENIKLPKIK